MARLKKRICCVVMAVVIVFTAMIAPADWMGLSVMVEAAETYGDYEYTVSGQNATITKYIGNNGSVVVPSQINGYVVTSIEKGAFAGCSSVYSIKLPESITYLGSSFISGTQITSITIPKNVTSVGVDTHGDFGKAYGPLTGAMQLKEVVFEDGMTSIPAYMCRTTYNDDWSSSTINNIDTIRMPDSIENIGDYAFYGCDKITSVTLPKSLRAIGKAAYYDCYNLNIVNIPKSVTSIYLNAFWNCENLSIYGYENSYAQSFAEEQNIPFVVLDDEEDDDYFILGVDTNRFVHYGLPYSIDNSEYKTKLYKSSLMTWDGTFQLYKYLNGKTSGVCHGIATTMCYGNQGFLDFDNIVKNANNYFMS